MTTTSEDNESGQPGAVAPLSEGLGPRCIECDGLVQWRCPTCAIRSQRAPLYTQDEIDARVAAERERCAIAGGAAADAGMDGAGVAAAIRGA